MLLNFTPTDEQLFAVELARQGRSLSMSAFAGASKTTTLKLIGHDLYQHFGRRATYVTFNRAIAQTAGFEGYVSAKTFNSLAFASKGRAFGARLNERLTGMTVAEILNLSPFGTEAKGQLMSQSMVGAYLLSVVDRFCQDLSPTLEAHHFPVPDILAPGLKGHEVAAMLHQAYKAKAEMLWRLMSDARPEATFPTRHGVYCKLWAMDKPRIYGDYAMLDEAQDSDKVMLHVMRQQQIPIIYVGDTHQQIYQWRGAVNAMEAIQTPLRASLTQSFRYGPELAAIADGILKGSLGETRTLRGNPKLQTRVEEIAQPKAILCRTNATVARYVVEMTAQGKKIAAPGVEDAIEFFEAAKTLQAHQRVGGKFRNFRSWGEIVEYSESQDGKDLAPYIKTEGAYGCDKILAALRSQPKDISGAHVDTVISTAHRAKGLEWSTVKLAGDFKDPQGERYTPEETRLMYVAITRAKTGIDITEAESIIAKLKGGVQYDAEAAAAKKRKAAPVPMM